jgi:hypothetical protein
MQRNQCHDEDILPSEDFLIVTLRRMKMTKYALLAVLALAIAAPSMAFAQDGGAAPAAAASADAGKDTKAVKHHAAKKAHKKAKKHAKKEKAADAPAAAPAADGNK